MFGLVYNMAEKVHWMDRVDFTVHVILPLLLLLYMYTDNVTFTLQVALVAVVIGVKWMYALVIYLWIMQTHFKWKLWLAFCKPLDVKACIESAYCDHLKTGHNCIKHNANMMMQKNGVMLPVTFTCTWSEQFAYIKYAFKMIVESTDDFDEQKEWSAYLVVAMHSTKKWKYSLWMLVLFAVYVYAKSYVSDGMDWVEKYESFKIDASFKYTLPKFQDTPRDDPKPPVDDNTEKYMQEERRIKSYEICKRHGFCK